MKHLLSLFVLCLSALSAAADEYTDPVSKVVYSYQPGSGTAVVTGGADAKGDITILERFTADGQEYVVEKVGGSSFKQHKGITGVSFPPTVKEIDSEAFRDCTSLTSVRLPEGLRLISLYAFSGSAISSVELPEGLHAVCWMSFSYCNRLKSVRIPSDIGYIEEGAFYFCDSLETIVVDEDNKLIDSRDGCNAIIVTATNELKMGCQGTVIPPSVKRIGESAFKYCQTLKEIAIPESVDTIGTNAFFKCRNLSCVSLPKSLRTIAPYAFMNTGLQTVTIPSGVKEIWGWAFAGIPTLTSITSLIENPFDLEFPICDEAAYSSVTLYVPAGTKEKYMTTAGWKDFKHIVEMDNTSVSDTISKGDAVPSPSYDFLGRPTDIAPRHGIYVRDGKKYVK